MSIANLKPTPFDRARMLERFNRPSPFVELFERRNTMLKPYVGAIVHYIPMSDKELRCESCDQPRAAIITRVHNDLDVDLLVFTSKRVVDPCRVRTTVSYALMTDEAPHWRWLDTRMLGETVPDPDEVATGEVDDMYVDLPLQDALRALIPGRGDRDRLLLERWALALEGNLVDTSVVYKVGEDGQMRVGIAEDEDPKSTHLEQT